MPVEQPVIKIVRPEKFDTEAIAGIIPGHILDAHLMLGMVPCMTKGNPGRLLGEGLYNTCIQLIAQGNIEQAEAAAQSLQGIFEKNIRNDIIVYRQTMDLAARGLLKEADDRAKNGFAILDIQKAVRRTIKGMAAQAKNPKPPPAGPQNLSA